MNFRHFGWAQWLLVKNPGAVFFHEGGYVIISPKGYRLAAIGLLIIGVLLALPVKTQNANLLPSDVITEARRKARLMYIRLAGVVPAADSATLTSMEGLIASGNPFQAAKVATSEDSFYNITVRNLAAPMSNRELSIDGPLNDFIATVIGNTRDGSSAKELLTGDYIYIGDSSKTTGNIGYDFRRDIIESNEHYRDLDAAKQNLRRVLKRVKQRIRSRGDTVADHPEPAGLLTTRAWGEAHLIAGTNRRAVQFTFSQFLCAELEEIADPTVPTVGPTAMISRDVTREPQGDHSVFQSKCRSCHNILDYLRPAYAHFNFDDNFMGHVDRLDAGSQIDVRSPAGEAIVEKYFSNESVTPTSDDQNYDEAHRGHMVTSSQWYNTVTNSVNAERFGWRGEMQGSGLGSFGAMVANSEGFSRCMVQRVFRSVCGREADENDKPLVRALAFNFEANNYRIRGLFEQLAARPECLGD